MKEVIYNGLSEQEAAERKAQGKTNLPAGVKTRTVWQIISYYLFTYLNLIIFLLALALVLFGAWSNTLFVFASVFNTLVGIVQDIRLKHAVDKLRVMTDPTIAVIRDGKRRTISTHEIVLDDILYLERGNQIPADSKVMDSMGLMVNEALLTGEAVPVSKGKDAELLSGSFVVAGAAYAQVIRVGAENYSSKIINEARKAKRVQSDLVQSISKFIKIIGILLVPLGLLLFASKYNFITQDFELLRGAVITSIGAMVGLIPQGLVVLTNVSLAVGVMKMSKNLAYFKTLPAVETMARLDTICFDKTGTLTEDAIEVKELVPLGNLPSSTLEKVIAILTGAMPVKNSTGEALAKRYGTLSSKDVATIPFSSETKWSAAALPGDGTYYMGAPEILLPPDSPIREQTASYAAEGYRVLYIGRTDDPLCKEPAKSISPEALVVLTDTIKPDITQVVHYLQQEGLELKVISGDAAQTVSTIAGRCKINGAGRFINMNETGDTPYTQLVKQYTVFGRTTPYQKRELIRAMQKDGHKVGMAGDGVNDVLALKEADLSLAMGSGSDAAQNIADVILLRSNFSSVPEILREGRKIISNIENVATLYLTKTVYNFLLIVLYLFLPFLYPFQPLHSTLISTTTIGIPSLFLTFWNSGRVSKGNFVTNVIIKALPSGIAVVINVLMMELVGMWLRIPDREISSLCVLTTGLIALYVLYKVCTPLHLYKKLLIGSVSAIFVIAFVFLKGFFSIPWTIGWHMPIALGAAALTIVLLNRVDNFITKRTARKLTRKT